MRFQPTFRILLWIISQYLTLDFWKFNQRYRRISFDIENILMILHCFLVWLHPKRILKLGIFFHFFTHQWYVLQIVNGVGAFVNSFAKRWKPFYCPNQLKTFNVFTKINRIKRNEKNVVSTWAQSWPLWKHIYVQWIRIWLYGVGRYEVGDDENPKQHCSKDNTWMLQHQIFTTKIMNNKTYILFGNYVKLHIVQQEKYFTLW